jgi:hypothetical protein
MLKYSLIIFSQNISNFKTLIDHCSSLGEKYQPCNKVFSILQMSSLHAQALEASLNYHKTLFLLKDAIKKRVISFSRINPYITRIFYLYSCLDISNDKEQHVVSLCRNIISSTNKLPKGFRSHEMKLHNFEILFDFLKNDDDFAKAGLPDLNTSFLAALLNDMQTDDKSRKLLAETEENLKKEFVILEKNIFDIARMCKQYLKSIDGVSSPIYKSVASLKFRKTPSLIALVPS